MYFRGEILLWKNRSHFLGWEGRDYQGAKATLWQTKLKRLPWLRRRVTIYKDRKKARKKKKWRKYNACWDLLYLCTCLVKAWCSKCLFSRFRSSSLDFMLTWSIRVLLKRFFNIMKVVPLKMKEPKLRRPWPSLSAIYCNQCHPFQNIMSQLKLNPIND